MVGEKEQKNSASNNIFRTCHLIVLLRISVDLLPSTGATVLAVFGVFMIGHIASTYSAVGQVSDYVQFIYNGVDECLEISSADFPIDILVA